jgi:hypothetical protein
LRDGIKTVSGVITGLAIIITGLSGNYVTEGYGMSVGSLELVIAELRTVGAKIMPIWEFLQLAGGYRRDRDGAWDLLKEAAEAQGLDPAELSRAYLGDNRILIVNGQVAELGAF